MSGLVVFAVSALVVSWASASRRHVQDALRRAHAETEQKVIERTADLRRTNAQLEAEIVERKAAQREVEHLAGRLIHAQEQERSRIGRELHDHISQRLGVLTIRIDQLRADPATPTARPTLGDLRRGTSEMTTDVHRLSHRLHSSMLDYLGLVPALQQLVAEFVRAPQHRRRLRQDGAAGAAVLGSRALSVSRRGGRAEQHGETQPRAHAPASL